MSLANKTIIITGGSRGIGRAAVEYLSAKAANVIFTYLVDEAAAKNVVTSCNNNSGKVAAYQMDVKDYSNAKHFIKNIINEYKQIDIIVNNAGIRKDKSLLYMGKEDWDYVIDTNLTGVFNLTKAAIPYLLKQRKGRVINISSISGINGLSRQVNYSSSKAGIIGFTKSLAKELAAYGICVNAIAPGAVETEMLNGLSEDHLEKLLYGVPIKRLCSPKEVAMTVNFLADDELSPQYLTGQVISLDGGMGL